MRLNGSIEKVRKGQKTGQEAFASCPAFLVPLGVEINPRFYRGKKNSFSMSKTSYCGILVKVWRPHYQSNRRFYANKERRKKRDKKHITFKIPLSVSHRITDSNLNHTGIYLYSKGKIMIHLTFDYKTDEKCTTPGQYLKYHRTFQGLSTRELAEKVGIVPATLVLYENDRHPIKYSTAVALANVLGIDRNRLLDEYTAFVDYPYFSLLKKVRQDLSLTQIQMAELIGIGQTSYSGWEREIRVPRRKEYDKILAALKKLRVNVDTYLCQSASI